MRNYNFILIRARHSALYNGKSNRQFSQKTVRIMNSPILYNRLQISHVDDLEFELVTSVISPGTAY